MSTDTAAMMLCEEISKVTVPEEFRSVLVEFTVSYLLQQPPNIANFGVDFFTKMFENQKTKLVRDQKAVDDVRNLCGDYEPAVDISLSMEAVEEENEVSLASSLPSLTHSLMRRLDNVLDASSIPSGEENAASPDSLGDMVESVDSVALPVEKDEEVVEQ